MKTLLCKFLVPVQIGTVISEMKEAEMGKNRQQKFPAKSALPSGVNKFKTNTQKCRQKKRLPRNSNKSFSCRLFCIG